MKAFGILIFVYLCIAPFPSTEGAADFEVEQVKLPEVEKHDVGQWMEQSHERQPIRRICSTCNFGYGGGSSAHSSSYSHSSSSSGGYASGENFLSYNKPVHSSSSQHLEQKKEFVNGQQVYDFHHETAYKDGKLVKNEKFERTPEQFGVYDSGKNNAYGSTYGNYHKTSHVGRYNPNLSSYRESNYRKYYENSAHGGQPQYVSNTDSEFMSNFKRLQEDLKRKTFNQNHMTVPNYGSGSSHKSEYESETKYVNGQPVYSREEERKYKNGELVHEFSNEKGPNELGTSNAHKYDYGSQIQTNTGLTNIPGSFQSSVSTEQKQYHSTGTYPIYHENSNVGYNQHHAVNKYNSNYGNSNENTESNINSNSYNEISKTNSNKYSYNKVSSSQNPQYHNYDQYGNIQEGSKNSYFDTDRDVKPGNHFSTTGTGHQIHSNREVIHSSTPDFHSSSIMESTINQANVNPTRVYVSPQINRQTSTHTNHTRIVKQHQSQYSNQGQYQTSAVNENPRRYDVSPNEGISSQPYHPRRYENSNVNHNTGSTYTPSTHGKQNNYSWESHSQKSQSRGYSEQNPLTRIETTTVYEYVNGRLSGERKYNKFYENGIVIHENDTYRNRDEMSVDGINVLSLDLSQDELKRYGPIVSSSKHSQRHEVYQVKRFRNGKPIYELNHERLFQDGNLVDENRREKNEHEFNHYGHQQHSERVTSGGNQNVHATNTYESGNRHIVTGDSSYQRVNPLVTKQVSTEHQVREEEKIINGQKVYGLYHEKKFQNGHNVHENRTEFNSNRPVYNNRETYGNVHRGQSGSHNSFNHQISQSQQHTNAQNTMTTSCLTCQHLHGNHNLASKLNLNEQQVHGYNQGRSHKHEYEVEEHYTDGRLIEGKEESRKWRDGNLYEDRLETYSSGPSRVNLTGYGHTSGQTAALIAPPVSQTTNIRQSVEECQENPCLNKGSCKARKEGPVCVCPFGFKGIYCEEAYCPIRYCRQGGTCSIEDGKHKCSCTAGYSGYRCSTKYVKARVGVSG